MIIVMTELHCLYYLLLLLMVVPSILKSVVGVKMI